MSNALDKHDGRVPGYNIYDFDNEIYELVSTRCYITPERRAPCWNSGWRPLHHGHFLGSFARHVVLEGSPAVIQNFRDKHPDCQAEIVETWLNASRPTSALT